MKKILLVFGTRPEAIKMCPLVKALRADNTGFKLSVCVTGQHREMLDQVLRVFDVKPEYDLDIMHPGQDLFDITSGVLVGLRDVLDNERPELVLVHGDTATSSAAALAAFYRQIPVGHVEAGLRTHNIYSPWPEEINRQITGRIASYNFAPTALAVENLRKENVSGQVFLTGNTVIDALHLVVDRLHRDRELAGEQCRILSDAGYDTDRISSGRRMVLVTGHRRENFGDGFMNICHALKNLSEKYPDTDFVYPMHLNPNVRRPINAVFDDSHADNIFFIEPLGYLSFVYLMEKAYVVLTDSGGIQEEAPGLGKPVLVMRDTTERPEAVAAGTVRLVGADRDNIVSAVSLLLDDADSYARMSGAVNPYGDGHACERIINIIKSLQL